MNMNDLMARYRYDNNDGSRSVRLSKVLVLDLKRIVLWSYLRPCGGVGP